MTNLRVYNILGDAYANNIRNINLPVINTFNHVCYMVIHSI